MIENIELLGVTECARRLGVHPLTIYRWCKTGLLPCKRDSSGKRLFDARDVEALIRKRLQR